MDHRHFGYNTKLPKKKKKKKTLERESGARLGVLSIPTCRPLVVNADGTHGERTDPGNHDDCYATCTYTTQNTSCENTGGYFKYIYLKYF